MNTSRLKIFMISLLMFHLYLLLYSSFIIAATRGLQMIGNLSHQSGKLGAYRALVIGIDDYKDPKIPDLNTAIKDAQAMSELLEERYGFQVQLILGPKATKKAIYRALRNLTSSSKSDDSVLIYYAGHGDIDRTYNDGWWIPADAKGGDPVTYLDNVQVQKAMRSMKARHVLLISDSCYSGTLFGQARAMPPIIDDKYYLNLYNEKSRWGMTSGNKTPVSDQGSDGHSVFAYQLLKDLRNNQKPYITIQEIYTHIAPIIGNNSEQTPLCRPIRNTGDQGGEFIFVADIKKDKMKSKKSAPNEYQRQQSSIDKDLLFWQSIKDTNDQSLYKEYLDKFPAGTFILLAKKKIEKLEHDTISDLLGEWRRPEAYTDFFQIEEVGNNLKIKIYNPYRRFERKIIHSKYGLVYKDDNVSALVAAEDVRLIGNKLEFSERRKGYDVYYQLILIDPETLKGIKHAEGSTHKVELIYKKMKD